ncbi:GrpB family protein [Geodermatophilus sp. TF02-6]|uniref:GrpB family protein n=1 Tax=Geodermatophilus sp. TF02-6 TaxID=2250575 RepID=UPI000DE8AE47|nr:GrpB family protein [Geodermatophilus sp. TF02-6]RBY75037.1 GrpB family protein [Geodermatophilus sp. TF02-6]
MTGGQSPQEAHLVGGIEHRAVIVTDYDPAWPVRYEAERIKIRDALGPAALSIEHIGSTSVPGLAAKSIIDIAVGVADVDDDGAHVAALLAAGYQLRVHEPAHRMLRTPALDVHVHVLDADSPHLTDHLALRDHLRRNPADRELYEQTKRRLAAMDWPSMNHYAQAKTEVITEILRHARASTAAEPTAVRAPANDPQARRSAVPPDRGG